MPTAVQIKNKTNADIRLKTAPRSLSNADHADINDMIVDYVDQEVSGATGYLVYTALISQSGTSAPTATVIKNTLGSTPSLARLLTGTFSVTAPGLFQAGKVAIFFGGYVLTGYGSGLRNSDDVCYIYSSNFGGTPQDGIFSNTILEIRVYP